MEPLRYDSVWWIPKGAIIEDVHVIAGKGASESLREAVPLSERLGGQSDGWMKKVGLVKSDRYTFDIHWYEHDDIGAVRHKIKAYKERG